MKRIAAIILILLTAFILYALNGLIPGLFYNLGKSDFERGNVPKAYSNLKIANKLNKKDKEIRYFYVKTLLKLKPTLEIQKNLFELSQLDQPDSADLIADRQIAKWRGNILLNAGENYIEQAPFNNKILRWDAKKFPLSINIQNTSENNLPQYYVENIHKAFSQWQMMSGNFIKFKFLENPDDADISVKIISSKELEKCDQPGCKYVVGYTMPKIQGNLLKKMEIIFYDLDNQNKPFNSKMIYNTALHEIGHSLGIMGHSYNKDDLMYMENNIDSSLGKHQSELQMISDVDLNTLSLLYKLIPDITNTPKTEYDSSRQFFAPIILGSEKQINSKKILEAQNYIESAPNLPNGYIDLAAALSEEKQYSEAIEALQKALTLCSTDEAKFSVNYNLAVIHMQIEDWDEAIKFAQRAKQYKSDSDIDGLIAFLNFHKGDKKDAKLAYINAFEQNPANETTAINLAVLYMRELNLIQAGKTLNKLIEVNPNAKSNPRIKSFGILMFFFK